jgi:hypothetical protein
MTARRRFSAHARHAVDGAIAAPPLLIMPPFSRCRRHYHAYDFPPPLPPRFGCLPDFSFRQRFQLCAAILPPRLFAADAADYAAAISAFLRQFSLACQLPPFQPPFAMPLSLFSPFSLSFAG